MSATSDTRRLSFADSAWIAAALLAAAAPHAARQPWWASALAAAFVAWHLYLARARLPAPGTWATAAIVAGTVAPIYLHYRTLFGRDPGVALLTLMVTLKLLEMRAAREATGLLALGFFLVLTDFLYSQTIATALYLLSCAWLLTAAMVRLQQRAAAPSQRLALGTAATLLAQSVPLMLVLFVLFPRVQGPLWGMPSDAHTGLTGLTDTMTPGSMSGLILSDEVAFRVQFKSGRPPPAGDLYWRGPVLWHFDGRTWTAPPVRDRSAPIFNATNQPVQYTVTMEPDNKRWLFALDLPGVVPPAAVATSDMQLIAREPVTTRLRYDMVSYLDYRYGAGEDPQALRRMRELPPGTNPRTVAFGRELRRRYGDDASIIAAVLRMFREQSYAYTLTPPLLGAQPVDEFLFDTRQGFCEHYSSAFAVLMRAAGIPARIVTGYLGGEVNPVGDYFIVRQADAHAWTEVWLRGEGWIRVDPTAAVSPARIERGIAAAMGAASGLALFVRTDFPLLRELHLGWDALAYRWNQWVLGYNVERQRYVASELGLGTSWNGLAAALAVATVALTSLLALFILFNRPRRPRDPVERAYARFCAALGKEGLARLAHEGPLDYGARVAASRPAMAESARTIARMYSDLRYGMTRSERGCAEFVAAVEEAIRKRVSRGPAGA